MFFPFHPLESFSHQKQMWLAPLPSTNITAPVPKVGMFLSIPAQSYGAWTATWPHWPNDHTQKSPEGPCRYQMLLPTLPVSDLELMMYSGERKVSCFQNDRKPNFRLLCKIDVPVHLTTILSFGLIN